MKVMLTSPDALVDYEEGEFFPGIVEVLDRLELEEKIAGTIVVSSNRDKLRSIPKKFNPLYATHTQKQGKELVSILVDKLPEIAAHRDLMVLGANDGDLRMSSNSKLLLFSAQYAQKNNPDSTVFNYGIRIEDPEHLYVFLSTFYDIGVQCFYELQIDEQTWLYSILNANSIYESDTKLKRIREKIKDFLKDHTKDYGDLFNYYFLMSLYTKIDALRKINYWCVYPSSKKEQYNPDIYLLKEQARKLFKCKTQEEIFIRISDSSKRSEMTHRIRMDDGCDSQFNTIILNPVYKNKLRGSTVCVIDDFTTYGSSCETARALLKAAGVENIIFVTIGKYGGLYIKHNYVIRGDVFQLGYKYKRVYDSVTLRGDFYYSANRELKRILGGFI